MENLIVSKILTIFANECSLYFRKLMKNVFLYLVFVLAPLFVMAQEPYAAKDNGFDIRKNRHIKSAERYLGDVNVDGRIDVTDVMCIVDYVLSKPLKVFAAYNADLSGNNKIDITDAMMIVDIILNKPTSTIGAYDHQTTDEVYVKKRESDLSGNDVESISHVDAQFE